MAQDRLPPPIAKPFPHKVVHQGHTLTDNYAWLQNKEAPEVIAYLEAENHYAKEVLKHTEPLQEKLYLEMRGRIKEDDSEVPQRHGDYFYYWRSEEGKEYRIFCRKHGTLNAPEEVLLDENVLAEGKEYCRVHICEPSPDHTLLAYSVDSSGALVFDLFIKNLRTGALLTQGIPNTAWTAAWASDSHTLFYTAFDDAHRAHQLFRHGVGQDPAGDALVHHEPDAAFSLGIHRSKSGIYLLVTLSSFSTSEVHYLPADQPDVELQVVHPRQQGMEYHIEHHGDRFLIRTNDEAENFRLMEAPVTSPTKEHWRELIPHRSDTLLEDVSAFRDHLAVFERKGGLKQIRLSDPDGVTRVRYIPFPEPVYTFRSDSWWETVNPEFNTSTLRFYYSSLVTPDSTVDYDMASETWEVKKQQEIPSGYNPTQYASERLMATASDGTQVPISLVYRKGLKRDGSHPLLLYGYGSYGFSLEADFDVKRLSLLDRGFVFAIAHIRGGSELGRHWYEQGRLMHKKNTFTDFIACAEHLITQAYTTPNRLAMLGASAGGLLVTAVMNMRPELCKAVVALVPFTNVTTAMLDPSLPLVVPEYEQWGHPDDPAAFAYMLSYSPYDNIEAKAYPHVFVKAGLNDLQVPYWDPVKWVAKLRAHKTDDNLLLLITNMEAGHRGTSGRYEQLRETAQVYAFLLDVLDIASTR